MNPSGAQLKINRFTVDQRFPSRKRKMYSRSANGTGVSTVKRVCSSDTISLSTDALQES